MKSIIRFWNELKRRNVPKGIITYVIFSWVLLQVISVFGSIIALPSWLGKTVLISLLVFLPFWLFFSWYYDITSEGIKKTETIDGKLDEGKANHISKRLNVFIITFLILAVILLFVDRIRLVSHNDTPAIISNVEKINSIAVLPFKDISEQQNQAYFSDGLTEELMITLSKISNIKVTSRTSAFSFKGKKLNIPTIAKKLNVNYILEGSVRTQDSIVRISVQLIDTKNDNYTWSQTWEKKLENIFQIQNEISETVAKILEIKITKNNIPKVKEINSKAYKLYLQAKYEFYNNIDGGSEIAENIINKSLQIDSTYAPSWELLSRIYHSQCNKGVLPMEKGYLLAKNAGLNAIKYDDKLASVYDIMATIAIDFKKDFKEAKQLVNKGLSMEPENPKLMDRAAEVALIFGDAEKALEYHLKLVALNPLDSSSFTALGFTYYSLKNFTAAETAYKKSIKLDPNTSLIYHLLSSTLLFQGRFEEALTAAKKEKDIPFRLHSLSMIYHALGNTKAANESLQELKETYKESYSFQIASTYAYYQDKENMFLWLNKALFYKDFGLIECNIEPLFNFCKDDPRWNLFMEKIGFIPEKIPKTNLPKRN